MSNVQRLIDEYGTKIVEAATQKQIDDVLALHKEFEAKIGSLQSPVDEIAAKLTIIAEDKSQERKGMWLIAALLHPSPVYLKSLCSILEQEEYINLYITVIEILQVIGHERAVPCLQRALAHDINYNAIRDLSANILIALGEIGTPAAIGVIEDSLASKHKKVREDAQLVLKIIRNQSK